MEFSYSVDGENRGSAESVDFQDLQMENLSLDDDDDDDDSGKCTLIGCSRCHGSTFS